MESEVWAWRSLQVWARRHRLRISSLRRMHTISSSWKDAQIMLACSYKRPTSCITRLSSFVLRPEICLHSNNYILLHLLLKSLIVIVFFILLTIYLRMVKYNAGYNNLVTLHTTSSCCIFPYPYPFP